MTLTFQLIDPDEYLSDPEVTIDDAEVDAALLEELATLHLAGIRHTEPEVLALVEAFGYTPAGPWLQLHQQLIQGIAQCMSEGAAMEFNRLHEAKLFPINQGPEPQEYEVAVKVRVMAHSPATAAAMVGGHIQNRLPVQIRLAEVQPGELAANTAQEMLEEGLDE